MRASLYLTVSTFLFDCFVFKEAIDEIEEWLGFLAKELFSTEPVIVLLLFVKSYFNILVLEDLLR